MIFYFSGTGNSRWAAEQIALLTGDRACDIIQLNSTPDIQNETQIGLVFPIYAWGVPEPMLHFAKLLGRTDAFTFAVCTCGADAGHAMKKLAKVYPLCSSYSLTMPNNYVIGSDVDDEQTARQKINTAQMEIQKLSQQIIQRKSAYRVTEGPYPGLKSGIVNWGFNKFAHASSLHDRAPETLIHPRFRALFYISPLQIRD